MARALTCVCAAVLALGLSGCTRDLCTARPTTDLGGLIIGFLCFGADYGDEVAPFAWISRLQLTVDSGETLKLYGSSSYDLDGDIIKFEGEPCRVVRVNDCAAVIAVRRPAREFTTLAGKTVHLQPSPKLARISPNAEVEILNR